MEFQYNDLLVVLGQATMEIAFLRIQLAAAQQKLKELEPESEKEPVAVS